MELSARKQAVLAAIIRAYIQTGEPVGSKILTELLDNAPSSATLRNEMSQLVEMGLLEQPHTSAGRIPTSEGYRFYVNSLMKPQQIPESTKRLIDSMLSDSHCDPEELPAAAGQILSELTGLPAISCYLTCENASVKRVELLRVGGHTVMVFVITNDGRARSRICRVESGITPGLAESFGKIIRERVAGKPLTELTRAYLQNIIAAAGLDSFSLLPMLTAVFEMADEAARSQIKLNGETSLYNMYGSEGDARRVISLIERRDPIISIFEKEQDNVGVVFGSQTGYSELKPSTIITARYNAGGRYGGRIGVIGPNRMSYDQIIPSIEYMASQLTKIMTEALKDMED